MNKPLHRIYNTSNLQKDCSLILLFMLSALFLQAFHPLSAQTGKSGEERIQAAGDVRINELLASNASVLVDEDGEYSDWLEIYNSGTGSVNLTGWYLSDDSTRLKKWTFPAISLPAGAYLIVFASGKDRTAPQLHTNFRLTADGEFLALTMPDTTIISSQFRPAFPLQATDVSYGSLGSSAAYFSSPTPGAVNAAGTVGLALSGNRIDEHSPDDSYIGSFITTDVDTGTAAVYSLLDDAGGRFKVAGNQLLVADSTLLDFATDTSHQITARSTYGAGSTVDLAFTIFLNQVFSTSLEISEFMASNQSTLQDEDGAFSDWVEIHNTGAADVNLENWYLTDNSGNLTKWQFPVRNLPAGGYMIVFASSKNRTGAELHTNFSLGASGEYLGLVQPDGSTVVAEYAPSYPPQSGDISYGLFGGVAQFFTVPTPGSANTDGTLPIDPLTISPERGYYNTAVAVAISTTTPGAEIRYTLDGSKPTPSNGSIYSGPVNISTTTVLRAAAYLTGYLSTRVETHTYLYLNDVIQQPYNIPGYPVQNYSLAGSDVAPHDYEMDPEIVNDPAYSGTIIKGLTDIPTMLISLDPDSLFGPTNFYDDDGTGIEQRVSMEYLDYNNPNRNEQLDCGIQGHSHLRLKRSLRLSFRSEYGSATWNTNIFKDAPLNGNSADKDQKRIVLRGGNNRSWARKWNPGETTYTEDQWFRDTQLAMTGYGAHGNFVHLYINGIYWGLYNPVERPDQYFSAEYFGGTDTDWYSANHDGTISGDPGTWDYILEDLVDEDMSNPASYAEMQQYLDIDNFSDYMMLCWFGAITDWPGKNFWGGNRTNPPGPFRFYNWDGEWSWDVTKDYSSVSGAWVHPLHRAGASASDEQSDIWEALRESNEFMTRFADRVYLHCFNGGALSDSSSLARWNTLNQYVYDAIIAESAKWGDCQEGLGKPVRKRDDDWQDEVDALAELMDGNVAQFIAALRAEGYYPDTDPPLFNQRGGLVPSGFAAILSNPNGSGTVYYTTDGSDPRASGGGIAGNAQAYSSPLTITDSTLLMTRVLDSGEWSAIDQVLFTVPEAADVILKVKVFLQGAYDSGSSQMTSTLKSAGYIPLASPYPENPRSVLAIPANITDWVLVELRNTPAGSEVISRSVLLRSDGMLVEDDGLSESVTIDVPAGNYYLVIRHRNHLSVMSATAVSLNPSSALYNFTTALSAAYTSESAAMKDLGGGVYGMFSADANADGQVTSSDFNTFLPAAKAAESGYHIADWNLDGQVTSSDFNGFNPNASSAAKSQVPGDILKSSSQTKESVIEEINHVD